MEQEIWKPVKGFEGYYEISNLGRVKSIDRFVKRGNSLFHCKEYILKQFINHYGYLEVSLRVGGRKTNKLIHRLIAESFIENPENKPCVDHINTIRTDNRIENLKWVTYCENTNNPITLQRIKNTFTQKRAEKIVKTKKEKGSWNGKRVFQYTKGGEFVAEHETITDAAKSLTDNAKMCYGNIGIVVDKPNRSAYGFRWYSKRIEPTQ